MAFIQNLIFSIKEVKVFMLSVVFMLLATITTPLKAQDLIIKAKLKHFAENGNKLSFFAGGGGSITNSDNLAPASRESLGAIIRANGTGSNLRLGAIYQYLPYVGVQGSIEYDRVNGSFKEENNTAQIYSFESDILSVSGVVVMHLANNRAVARLYSKLESDEGLVFVPYIKAGLGVLHYSATNASPQGSGEKAGWAGLIPIGGGLRVKLTNNFGIAPEGALRIATSDYLDNIKAGRTPEIFGTLTLNFIYTLP